MTALRDVVELPGMPAWVRFALTLMAAALLRVGATWAQPMVESGWVWSHGIASLLALLVAVDLLHSAARKRWPLVLFLDLLFPLLASRRSSR